MGKENQLIKRCCVCQAIVYEGKIVQQQDYNEQEMLDRGHAFTDTILSKNCMRKQYSGTLPEDGLNKIISKLEYDICVS